MSITFSYHHHLFFIYYLFVIQDYTLRSRANRILNSKPGSSLHRHRYSLASAIVGESWDPIIIDATHPPTQCSAPTWVGSGRVLWRDLYSHNGKILWIWILILI